MSKPRIVKDFDKVPEEIIDAIKLAYPHGFEKKLIRFKNMAGKFVSALPFETDDRYYLIRMTASQAQEIIEEDDDYNDEGNLTDVAKERIENELLDSDDDFDEEVVDTDDDDE